MKKSSIGLVIILGAVAAAGYVASNAYTDRAEQLFELHQKNRHRLETIPDHPAVPTRFVDMADAAGLNYQWSLPGQTPRNVEQVMGCGCAFLDYNNDGNLDILLVGKKLALYEGDGHGTFKDVTQATGLDQIKGDFRGCAVGDYDNDGFDDILLTGYHCGALLHNEHGVRFSDVTARSGIDFSAWSTSAAWGELEHNGRLDLYVGNYLDFKDHTPGYVQACPDHGIMTTCRPNMYTREIGRLYRNNGDGTFTDVTHQWGLDQGATGYVLGEAFADFDGSGRESLFVADDQVPSTLFRNMGNHFVEIGRSAGVAISELGVGYAGMGIDWGDYDNDGKLDLAVMDYWEEKKRILHNDGDCVFENQYDQLGFPVGGYPRLAFGAKWLDYDNDGWLDLIYCNGFTNDNIEQVNQQMPWKQPTLLYHNVNGKLFQNVSAGLGDGMRPILGRGLATGDFDNDGRIDVLVVDNTGKPLLLHNETPGVGHWLELKLIGAKSNRDGYGAMVHVTAGSLHLLRHCHSDGSYESSSDSRVHIGLGGAAVASDVTIDWPSGQTDHLTNVTADRILTITEGKGITAPAATGSPSTPGPLVQGPAALRPTPLQ